MVKRVCCLGLHKLSMILALSIEEKDGLEISARQ